MGVGFWDHVGRDLPKTLGKKDIDFMRKEVTGGLDDTQLRNLETRLGYLRELEDRRRPS